jgi:hypothetical protein
MIIEEKEKNLRDQIHQLIMVADTFLKYTEQISAFYDDVKQTYGLSDFSNLKLRYFLVMQQRLYFQETILIVCSLFQKPGKNKEISFETYNQITHDLDFQNDINKLSDGFKNSAFFFFRDKLLAHKDNDLKIDQTSAYWNPIFKSHLEDMRYYVDEIKIILGKHWKDTIANNYFADVYDPCFDRIFGIVKQDISFEIKKLRGEL